MGLGRKNLLYSMALAVGLLVFLVGYFICMLPSLYVDYVCEQNLRSVLAQHRAYMECGTYEAVRVRNPTACFSVEIPVSGDYVLLTGKAFSAEVRLRDQRLREVLDRCREGLFKAWDAGAEDSEELWEELGKNLEELAAFCQRHGLLVVADDIYTNFCYGEPFFPIRALPGMAERTVTVNSFSKNYIMTGFRIGNIVAPAAVIRAIQQLNEYVVFTAPSVSQRGAMWALRSRKELEPPLWELFRGRMQYAAERMNQIPWMSVPAPQGSMYLFPSIKRTGLTSAEVTRRILEEAHVLVLPGNTFGACGEGHLRVACTVENEVMGRAFDRISKMEISFQK